MLLLFLYYFILVNIIQLKILSKHKQRVAQRRTIFVPLVLARELWETILCLRKTINTQCWLEGTFGCRRTLLKTLPTNWKTWMISFQSITSNTQKSRGQHNPRGRTTTQLQETTSAFEYNFYHPKRYLFIRTSTFEIKCTYQKMVIIFHFVSDLTCTQTLKLLLGLMNDAEDITSFCWYKFQ